MFFIIIFDPKLTTRLAKCEGFFGTPGTYLLKSAEPSDDPKKPPMGVKNAHL